MNKKNFSLVSQNVSEVEFDNGNKLEFFTPNNIGIQRNIYKVYLEKYKKTLNNHAKKLDLGEDFNDVAKNKIEEVEWNSKMVYELIQFAEISIIFSYTMIEALVNYSIPDDYVYVIKNNKGIEERYDRQAIERHLSLTTKLKSIISDIYKIDKITDQPFWSDFCNLESIRNTIIHEKVSEDGFYLQFFEDITLRYIESPDKILEFLYSKIDMKNFNNSFSWPFYENKNGMSLPQVMVPDGGFKKMKISVPGHDNITFPDLKDIYK